MLQSKHEISQLVADEIKSGTAPHRIFLGGFSQGGAMSLLVGLCGEHKLAALAILSSWLPLRADFKSVRYIAWLTLSMSLSTVY
jgi:lysophospholipase-1